MSLDVHRLSILTAKEIDAPYGLSHFTAQERQIYFDLSILERAAVAAPTPAVAVHLTLQLGYFKAKRQFFLYNVFVRESTEFRRFEDDLISDARWQDKETVLHEIGAPLLQAPIQETLRAFRETLETKFHSVNQCIADGENQHIKITGPAQKRRWTLLYPHTEESVNSPFYDRSPGIRIADLLWFVAEQTGFSGVFTHLLDRYVTHDPDLRAVLACTVALGTNMGLWKKDVTQATVVRKLASYVRQNQTGKALWGVV